MDNKITLTISSLFNGEGFNKAGQAVKGMSKSVKDTTQAVGQLAGEMSGMNGTVGKVADGIGKFIGALSGGALSIAIVGITTAVGLFSKWRDSIEKTRKKNRELMEEMEDGYGRKVASALDYVRQKEEELLNLTIEKGKKAIERLERIRDLNREMANARYGTQNAQRNLDNQRFLTQQERRKSQTTNQFSQRDIDLQTRQEMNFRNRNQLRKQRKIQEQQLDADEKLLKDKISELESQKGNLPQYQKNRRESIQRQIDEKNRLMEVEQERINYYHDQNINGEGDYDENAKKQKEHGEKRVKLSEDRLKLQQELARLERGDAGALEDINERIKTSQSKLAIIEEKRKTDKLNHETEMEKLEQERYKIEVDRNKLAEDRKKFEAEEAKKAKEKSQKEAKARANANADRIEAEAKRKSSSYESKEAQALITTRGRIDALNAKRQGLSTPEEIEAWRKEMADAVKSNKDAIKAAQNAVKEGRDKKNETIYQITEGRWLDALSKRDRLGSDINNNRLTKKEVEALTKQMNYATGEANRLRNSLLQQASKRTSNATPEDKMDAITEELQLLRAVEEDIRNQSVAIANNTRQGAADNLTGDQRKAGRNAADDQNKLNKKIAGRERAQNNAADRDIAKGGWFLDENGNLKSNKGNMAPRLTEFQRKRLIQRLQALRLQQQQKAVAQRIQQVQQQQVNAVRPIPQTLQEIERLLQGNFNLLNFGINAR